MIKADPDRKPGPFAAIPPQSPPPIDVTNHLSKPAEPPAWFDLDRYSRYRDPLMVIGFVMVLIAVLCFNGPGALALAGLGVIYVSYLMGK